MKPVDQGYDNARFPNVVNKKLHCQICNKVLKDPVQCHGNGHHFCTPCITRHLKQSHLDCPRCSENLTEETLVPPSPAIANALFSLLITCDYSQRGCNELVELGVLKTHVENCSFAPVVCSNEGCMLMINKRDKRQHESNECVFRKSDDGDSEVHPIAMRQTSEESDSNLSAFAGMALVGGLAVVAGGSIFGLLRRFTSVDAPASESPRKDQSSFLEDYEFPSDSELEAEGEEYHVEENSVHATSSGKSLAMSACSLPPRRKAQLEDFEFTMDSSEDEIEFHPQLSGPFPVSMEKAGLHDIGVSSEGAPKKTKKVGQNGGEVLLDDISLIVPRHSLEDEVDIKVTHEDPMPYQSQLLNAGLKMCEVNIEYVIKLEPSGVAFLIPASIRVKIEPQEATLFILHGTRDVDGFIEWEDVTHDVLVNKPGKNESEIILELKTFCRYAVVRSSFNIPGRIIDSLNCKFQTRSVVLFKRPLVFQQCFDTRVVFMTDKVFKKAYESSQAHDLVNNEGYAKCDSGSVKKVYTNRDLDIHCEVFHTDKQLKTRFQISSSRLNQIGDIFDEFSNVEQPRKVKGHFVITQKQKREEKHLWNLRFWDEEDKVPHSPEEVKPVVKKEEGENLFSEAPNSGTLTLTDMEKLSKAISTKWVNLARLLNIDNDVVEDARQNVSNYPDEPSKALRILKLFNSDPRADVDDLVNALQRLELRVPVNLQNRSNSDHVANSIANCPRHATAIANTNPPTKHDDKTWHSSENNEQPKSESVTKDTTLSGREIEMLSRNISMKWRELGCVLNIARYEIDNLNVSLIYINVTDKAAKILELYNVKPGFSREELGKILEEIRLPGLRRKVLEGEYRRLGKNGMA